MSIKDEKNSSVLYQGTEQQHEGSLYEIAVKILSAHRTDTALRQIMEAKHMAEDKTNLNRKLEWNTSTPSHTTSRTE